MGINTEDIENMMLSIRDNKAPHDKDLNLWIQAAMYRYTTGDIKLHEVQLLERIHDLNIQERSERYRIYTIISTAKQHGYIE